MIVFQVEYKQYYLFSCCQCLFSGCFYWLTVGSITGKCEEWRCEDVIISSGELMSEIPHLGGLSVRTGGPMSNLHEVSAPFTFKLQWRSDSGGTEASTEIFGVRGWKYQPQFLPSPSLWLWEHHLTSVHSSGYKLANGGYFVLLIIYSFQALHSSWNITVPISYYLT